MQTTQALALALAALPACTIEAQTDRLHVVGNGLTSSEEEVQTLLEVGEDLLTAIAALHPADVALDDEVRVELHGWFRWTSPYVDDEGTVHLWRFSESEGGYRAMYAHELVHAIAYDALVAPALDRSAFAGFYLEGWAEYVALLVDPGKTGFSLFGFDEDVVVGHWLTQGGPTLAAYRERHEELNLRCQGQAYILRASWFRYVDEVLGREVVLDLAAAREGLDPDAVERMLGAPLEEVDADWEAWARARYDAHPDAEAQAAAYEGRMGWYEPCLD
ncbi:MAG: hypothetical protein H6732_01785 [Alphaproteobacteria bacterium]|nr:hypothetical protein [Alphaproteobacteria bacterium]